MKLLLLFLLVGAACVGCSHVTPFERCVTDQAARLAALRVQAAISCKGDHTCIEQGVIDDVQFFAATAEQCKMETLDGGK